MADYKTIHGVNLRDYTTDPDTLIEGQVWYDKTNKVVQFFHNNVTTAGSWRTGNNLTSGRSELAGAGTQTSALMFGGTPNTGKTESYSPLIMSSYPSLKCLG